MEQQLLSVYLCLQVILFTSKSDLSVASVVGVTAPVLNQRDANPCVLHNSSVKEFSADIWLVHNNYSACAPDTEKFKASVYISPSPSILFVVFEDTISMKLNLHAISPTSKLKVLCV